MHKHDCKYEHDVKHDRKDAKHEEKHEATKPETKPFVKPEVKPSPTTGGIVCADAIYYGGPIITMQSDDSPEQTHGLAVVVTGGKITFVGSLKEASKYSGYKTEWIDLKGSTLLPGFFEAHSHFLSCWQIEVLCNIFPHPDGPCNSLDDIVNTLSHWSKQPENQVTIQKFGGWICGFGYDDANITQQLHPTRDILDKISKDIPIMVSHASGHLGSINSIAFEKLGITEDIIKQYEEAGTGTFLRDEHGKPNGVITEMAFFKLVLPVVINSVTLDYQPELWKKCQEIHLRHGITTAMDGRTDLKSLKNLNHIIEKDPNFFDIDLIIYPDYAQNRELFKNPSEVWKKYSSLKYVNRLRIGGGKMCLDGSIQGKTGYLRKPYCVTPIGEEPCYRGFPQYTDINELATLYGEMLDLKIPSHTHVNGDAAIDQFVQAFEIAKSKRRPFPQSDKYTNVDSCLTVAVHALMANQKHLDKFRKLKIIPTFFGAHVYYWGDWHFEETIGQKARDIAPAHTAYKNHMLFTEHHDAPVSYPNPIVVLSAIVLRRTRSGKLLGPEERLTAYQGLLSLCKYPAIQCGEDYHKGTIEAGKLADFVIISKNPLQLRSAKEIETIKIVQTIKEGKVLYRGKVE